MIAYTNTCIQKVSHNKRCAAGLKLMFQLEMLVGQYLSLIVLPAQLYNTFEASFEAVIWLLHTIQMVRMSVTLPLA